MSCPRTQAWRAVAIEAPPGQGDLVAGLVLFMERAIDYYAAALPLTAGSLANSLRTEAAAAGLVPGRADGLAHRPFIDI